MQKKLLTRDSYKKLMRELEERKFKIRKEISEEIKEAKEFGDLSENASYKETREQESFNEARIEQLEEIIREAQIVDNPSQKNVVEIGDTVELSSGLLFQLVDSMQTDPPAKISLESPIGKAVFGRKLGDEIKVVMPNTEVKQYKIVKIIERT